MKANETSSKADVRINRIKKVSGVFSAIFLIIAILAIASGVGGIIISGFSLLNMHISKVELYAMGGNELACALWAWCCFKLFSLYSRGDLFTVKVVSAIRHVGYAYFLMIVVGASLSPIFNYFGKTDSLPPPKDFPEWFLVSLNLATGLFSGFLIIFIAWIMDEGRKIKEEQELTV